jgi:hypothetical protein
VRGSARAFLGRQRRGVIRLLEQIAHRLVPEQTRVGLADDVIEQRVCGELLIFDTNQQFATHKFVNKFLAMVRNANGVLTPNIEVVAVFVASIRGRCLFPVIVAAGGRYRL